VAQAPPGTASVLANRGATAHDIAQMLGDTVRWAERTYIHSYEAEARERLRRICGENVRNSNEVREAATEQQRCVSLALASGFLLTVACRARLRGHR
jgi:predicted transcriptional regulator